MSGNTSEHWNKVAETWSRRGYADELLAEHKRNTYLDLIDRWTTITHGQKILKTDLFTEASDIEQFSFEIAKTSGSVIGIDISHEIVEAARNNARKHGADDSMYLCCDVRYLPLQNDSIDLVISDSTLDHFPTEADIITALSELGRVVRTDGTLIITLDNKANITYPPYPLIRLWMKLGRTPYFIGKTLSLSKLKHSLEQAGFTVEQSTAVFHYPHPDSLVRWSERALRKIGRGKLDNVVRRVLTLLDKCEHTGIKYLTGRYIAVKAIKTA
jgi:SAM-dependent methyltransferase